MLDFLKKLIFDFINKKTGGKANEVSRKSRNAVHPINKYNEKEVVKLNRAIDGDTAWFRFKDGKEYKVRFLYIDTPEATKTVEKYGPEASKFVRNHLKNADKIELEFDFERVDRHNRILAWVWVYDRKGNKQLLQELVAAAGYVEKFYDYGTYKYENQVKRAMNDKYGLFQPYRGKGSNNPNRKSNYKRK